MSMSEDENDRTRKIIEGEKREPGFTLKTADSMMAKTKDVSDTIAMSEFEMAQFSREFGAKNSKNTDVARQSHYMNLKLQPIYVESVNYPPEQFIGVLRGAIDKYLARYAGKDGIKDLLKARVYLNWLIEYTWTGKITVPQDDLIIRECIKEIEEELKKKA